MKNDSKAPQAGAETNEWVDQITGSAGFEGAVLFFGYAGKSAADPDNSISLYLDAALGKKLDIRKEDILFSRKTTDSNNLEAMLVWTKKSVQHATETETSAASFLQGDIYNTYLNQNAIPTVPVMSCVTCTGVPFVCSEAPKAAAQAQGPIPTVPVVSCVTCTGIPFVCAQAANTGQQTNVQGTTVFPTAANCFPPTFTPPFCGGQTQNSGLQANAAINIPTIPVVSCITCTGIPAVCAQAPQSATNTGLQSNAHTNIPTVPVVSCVSCTHIPFICNQASNAAQQGNLQTVFPTITLCSQNNAAQVQGAIPTLPIEACVPTMPVISCVTCTGLPFVCSQAPNAAPAATSNAQIDIPTVPVVSCVTCTHIPLICNQGPLGGQQANLQTNIPTMPGFSCVVCPTTPPAGCVSNAGAGMQSKTAFPTYLLCSPNAGMQPLQANAQGAIPTLPIEACVPTMPVVSCVTCTGIPFVC